MKMIIDFIVTILVQCVLHVHEVDFLMVLEVLCDSIDATAKLDHLAYVRHVRVRTSLKSTYVI